MSQSVTVLSSSNGSAVLTRRCDYNIGIEDDILCDIEDDLDDLDNDERDVTLRRQETGFHIGTARKVNGTSERTASGGNKNKKHFNFFQNKAKSDLKEGAGESVNKTPRRVERSKSELGAEYQHKKLIPHSSQGKPDISDTNKKILAHWNSGVERGMKLFQYGFAKTKWEEQQQQQQQQRRGEPDGREKLSTLGSKRSTDMNKSCDGIQQSLQNVLTLKKHFDASQIFSTLTLEGGDKTLLPNKQNDQQKYIPVQTPDRDEDCLEKYLELDHGEFQFIDDAAATLTRGVSPPPGMTKHLSISSLASEIFQELGQPGLKDDTLKPDMTSSSTSRFRQHHQRRQRNLSSASLSAAVPLEPELSNGRPFNSDSRRPAFQNNSQIDITTANKATPSDGTYRRQRRQRNLSSASMSAVVLGDEVPQYMTASWTGEKEIVASTNDDSVLSQRRPTFQNDSQLVASLIADQTLFLRHHQKRKQQLRRQQQWSVGKWQLQSKKDDQTAVVTAGQLQLSDQTQQLLRRCSSLTQTYCDDIPTSIAAATSATTDQPPSSRSSVHLPDYPDRNENGSTRLSSPGTSSTSGTKNIRYLYSGKYRPTFSQDPQQLASVNGNNNHERELNNLNQSPWLLSNNLSSFARRRRSSSTSLHTYEDDVDDNCIVPHNGHLVPNNNKKLNNGDQIPDYR